VSRVDERTLLRKAQAGNTEAFAQIYRGNVQRIYRYIYQRVNQPQVAEDITSEVFTRALEGLSSYRDQGKPFIAWLYRIAHDRVIDYYRRTGRRPADENIEDNPLPFTPDMDERIMRREAVKALQQAMDELTDDQRRVVIMRFIEGQRIEKVAQIMGKNANAIKALQHRALQAMAKRLQKSGLDIEAILAGLS
jgi:RNA polymerase sigma-70 factor, ECF subfamily